MNKIFFFLYLTIVSFSINALPQENIFIGEWDVSFDEFEYNFVFLHSNLCIITVKNKQSGKIVFDETNGTWSYDQNFVRINGTFSNINNPNLTNMAWVGIYSFFNMENSAFHMRFIRPEIYGQRIITFIRTYKLMEEF